MSERQPADDKTQLETIERMILGGEMPHGWSLGGTVGIVHSAIVKYRKRERELNERVYALETTIRVLTSLPRSV